MNITIKANEREARFIVASLNHYAQTLRAAVPNDPKTQTSDDRKTASAAGEVSGLCARICREMPVQESGATLLGKFKLRVAAWCRFFGPR